MLLNSQVERLPKYLCRDTGTLQYTHEGALEYSSGIFKLSTAKHNIRS